MSAPTIPEQRKPPADRPQACPHCGLRLPPRRSLRPFAADAIAERARLAMLDPAGEYDSIGPWPRRFDWATQTWEPERTGWHDGAVRPLDGVKARQVLLHLSEPQPRPYRPAPRPGTELDEHAILERLGCDLTKHHGVIRCPAHEDRSPSLSWRWDGSKALLHCFRGCTFAEIRAAL